MIDFKKVYEDAVAAAGAAPAGGGGIVAAPGEGVGATDVLGNHSHDGGAGYMHDGCFHLPKGSGKVQSREIFAGKKKKNQKNDYIKGMKIISEAGVDKASMIQLEKYTEADLAELINKEYDIKDVYPKAIVYCSSTETFFLKFITDNNTKFIEFYLRHGKYTKISPKAMDSQEVKAKLSKFDTPKHWIVWGEM